MTAPQSRFFLKPALLCLQPTRPGTLQPKMKARLDGLGQIIAQRPHLCHQSGFQPERQRLLGCASWHPYMHFPVAAESVSRIYTCAMNPRKANIRFGGGQG